MVVDEELKMMARMCTKGGSINGPLLKEMSRLIHTEYLLTGKPSLYISLGHQILCKNLRYSVKRKQKSLQSSQQKIDFFERQELVGFYNTFTPLAAPLKNEFQTTVLPLSNELVAIRGPHFAGFQFHSESILTQNGRAILQEAVTLLL